MRKTILIIAMSAAITMTSQAAFAAANQSSNGDNNGKPFQELNQLIDDNRSMIVANQDAISSLNLDITAINARIDGVESDLAVVAAQVNDNTADISSAFQRIVDAEAAIGANDADIAALTGQLGSLIAQHNADIASIQASIGAIEARLNTLSSDAANLAATLDARVAELRGLIDNNAIAIDGLLLDVTLINAQLTTINSNYNVLSNQLSTLNGQISSNSSSIANLTASLAALKSRVDAYHDPCLEFISIGQSVTGELVNDGVCTSDSRNYGGTHGGRYYTFTVATARTVTIDMEGQHTSQGTLSDPYLYLEAGGRDGTYITQNDDGGYYYNSRIVINLQPGTYTIEATSFYYTQFGTYRLTVQ